MVGTQFFLLWNLGICLMMILNVPRARAGFSSNGCDIPIPNSRNCYGRGTSDCADAIGNLLNGNETYIFMQMASLNYIIFLGVAKYDWQAGVEANLLFLGAVAFLIHVGPQLFIGTLEGCPTFQPVSNTNTPIGGFNFLTGADITTAVNMFNQLYVLQCNVYPMARLLNTMPRLNVFLNIDVSGCRSFMAQQNGNPTLKNMAQNNIVLADVIVNTIPLTSQITVQQANASAVSAACVVSGEGGDVNQVLGIAGGNTNILLSLLQTGDVVCAIATALVQAINTRVVNLLDTIKLVTITKLKVYILSVGYGPNFLPNDFVDGLLAACNNQPK